MNRLWILLPALALAATGCIKQYKLDVQQGSVVTPEMVARVNTGMTRHEVRNVLGTPPLADPFHADRWDYVYSFREGGAKTAGVVSRVTVYFSNDVVARIDNSQAAKDIGQSSAETAAPLTPDQTVVVKDPSGEVKDPGKPKQESIFRRVLDKITP